MKVGNQKNLEKKIIQEQFAIAMHAILVSRNRSDLQVGHEKYDVLACWLYVVLDGCVLSMLWCVCGVNIR